MGYANSNQKAAGIHTRLFSRAFIVDDGSKRVLFVSADIGMVSQRLRLEVFLKFCYRIFLPLWHLLADWRNNRANQDDLVLIGATGTEEKVRRSLPWGQCDAERDTHTLRTRRILPVHTLHTRLSGLPQGLNPSHRERNDEGMYRDLLLIGWLTRNTHTVIRPRSWTSVTFFLQSIDTAHRNIKPGRIFVNKGVVPDSNLNRSPHSYMNNPKDERNR